MPLRGLLRWKKSIVYIIGGSSGIGYACAQLLSNVADVVVVIARRKPLIDQVVARLRTHSSTSYYGYSVDVSLPQCRSALGTIVDTHGAPHLLVNAAGMVIPAYFSALTHAQLQNMLMTNIGGAWNSMQELIPRMKSGTVLNISSFAGLLGIVGYSAYAASKYGLIGLSEALRHEYGDINISVLCPTDTDTPQLEQENKTKPPEVRAVSGAAKPLSATFVAGYALNQAGKRFLLIPGFFPKLVWNIKKIAPSLVYSFIDRALDRARTPPKGRGKGRKRARERRGRANW